MASISKLANNLFLIIYWSLRFFHSLLIRLGNCGFKYKPQLVSSSLRYWPSSLVIQRVSGVFSERCDGPAVPPGPAARVKGTLHSDVTHRLIPSLTRPGCSCRPPEALRKPEATTLMPPPRWEQSMGSVLLTAGSKNRPVTRNTLAYFGVIIIF